MAVFYDTHAHLDYPDFAPDLSEVIARAEAASITKIISIGTDLDSSERAISLSERFPQVFAAVGWHPSSAEKAPADFAETLRRLASHPRVVAIGETGLDFHHFPSEKPEFTAADDDCYRQKQDEVFRAQLEVASDLGLNCIIHQRDALEETLRVMREYAARVRGVFHCFANDAAAQKRIQQLGCLVSFTGIVTFKNGQNVREVAAATPLDQMMLETDCPYLAPVPYRGKRCEPAYVREIAQTIAQVKGCSTEELSSVTCQTAHQFFPGLIG